jgi:hypothetical protein
VASRFSTITNRILRFRPLACRSSSPRGVEFKCCSIAPYPCNRGSPRFNITMKLQNSLKSISPLSSISIISSSSFAISILASIPRYNRTFFVSCLSIVLLWSTSNLVNKFTSSSNSIGVIILTNSSGHLNPSTTMACFSKYFLLSASISSSSTSPVATEPCSAFVTAAVSNVSLSQSMPKVDMSSRSRLSAVVGRSVIIMASVLCSRAPLPRTNVSSPGGRI